MHSPKRLRSVARPRQIAMHLGKTLTTFALQMAVSLVVAIMLL